MHAYISRRTFARMTALAACGTLTGVAYASTSNKDAGGSGRPEEPPAGTGPAGGPDGKPGDAPGGQGGPGGAGGPGGVSQNVEGTAATELADGDQIYGGTYTAREADQSVIAASGNVEASIDGATIDKAAGDGSSADASSFYGVNAAVRVYGDAHVTMNNCTIHADAGNATGVFAYQNGRIEIADSIVEVTGGGAGGVQVAGGGTLVGTNLTVTSASKAAIRSDRGGGVLELTGGTYTSTGTDGCPAIYSTAEITVHDAVCVSERSRAVIIEGKNSVTVDNCKLIACDQSARSDALQSNVLLYQSMSGDADEGVSVFTMTGGSMECKSGAMFYCTNTSSVVNLEAAQLTLSDDETLLIAAIGRWGNEGSNGGDCTFNASKQTLQGAVQVDDISSVTLNLTQGSTFVGCINAENTSGYTALTLDETSSWTLTCDSYLSTFDGDVARVDGAGFTLYVDGVAIN